MLELKLDSPVKDLYIGRFKPPEHESVYFIHAMANHPQYFLNETLLVQHASYYQRGEHAHRHKVYKYVKAHEKLVEFETTDVGYAFRDQEWIAVRHSIKNDNYSIAIQQSWAAAFASSHLYPEVPNKTLWRFYETYDKAVLACTGSYAKEDNQYCIRNIDSYRKEFQGKLYHIIT